MPQNCLGSERGIKMKKILLMIGILIGGCQGAFATQITFPTVYGPTSQVTNTTLNGDNNAISNVVNGSLDNTNANTASGYRFYQTVSSLPSAGNTGQVYYLTSDNSLNFDTGSTFIKTIAPSGSPAQGNVLIYGASGLVYAVTGTVGQVFTSGGAGTNPTFSTITYAQVTSPVVKVSNTQTQNTAGGSTTSGGWNTVVLNTKDTDSSSIGTLSSNAITLPAGTYNIFGSCPLVTNSGTNPGMAQCRLYNNTAAAVSLNGTTIESAVSTGSGTVFGQSMIIGQVVIASQSTFILQYNVTTSVSTDGLGYPGNFGTEVYQQLMFTKVA